MANSYEKKKYTESDDVKQAQTAYQQQQSAKPASYQSQWQGQMNGTLDKIMNRQPFQYDINGDALYQQYKDQYVQQGKQAMMDTMGQAQTMTGGYGNSYAQTAGQQAYQGYLQGLNDKIPDLYQMALEQYQMEGDDLLNQYGIMQQQEGIDYDRYRDSVSDWDSETDRRYQQWLNERSFDYGEYSDDLAYEQWAQEFAENNRRYDQEWEEAHSEKTSSGGGSGSGSGSGDNGTSLTTTAESDVEAYVKNMLDNAQGSQFDPNRAIDANVTLTASQKAYAKEVAAAYIEAGYMKF